jgi:hypothetical protein
MSFKPLFAGHRETCYNCNKELCQCEEQGLFGVEPDDGLGFYDTLTGSWIHNPFVSLKDNYHVDPEIYYGGAYDQWCGTNNCKVWWAIARDRNRPEKVIAPED